MTKTMLVVDDDEWIRNVLKIVLESEGYEVALASDGIEAIEHIDRRTPSLILLDLMMPNMNGFEFAERLRERDLDPPPRILVLTAASQAWLKAQWVEADACVEKPFDVDTLLSEIARLEAPGDFDVDVDEPEAGRAVPAPASIRSWRLELTDRTSAR
jgi:two-component system, chemotaxis family, chemotaxis protein CheY